MRLIILESRVLMHQDVETSLIIMDEVGDQITGCKGVLEDFTGVKAPVARQGQVSGLQGQSLTDPFETLPADQSGFQHPGFEGTLSRLSICCRNNKNASGKT